MWPSRNRQRASLTVRWPKRQLRSRAHRSHSERIDEKFLLALRKRRPALQFGEVVGAGHIVRRPIETRCMVPRYGCKLQRNGENSSAKARDQVVFQNHSSFVIMHFWRSADLVVAFHSNARLVVADRRTADFALAAPRSRELDLQHHQTFSRGRLTRALRHRAVPLFFSRAAGRMARYFCNRGVSTPRSAANWGPGTPALLSTPFASHTTSSPSMAHERASSTLLKVVTFASRSFSTFFAIFSGLRPT